jgi:hypothetical protein
MPWRACSAMTRAGSARTIPTLATPACVRLRRSRFTLSSLATPPATTGRRACRRASRQMARKGWLTRFDDPHHAGGKRKLKRDQ